MDDDEWLFRSVLEYDTLEVFSLQSATRLLTLAGDAETLFIASFNSDGENVKSEIQRLCLPSCKIDETVCWKRVSFRSKQHIDSLTRKTSLLLGVHFAIDKSIQCVFWTI